MMRSTFAIAAAVAGLGVAGCGGDDKALTKAEFVKQGNAICAKGNAELETEEEELIADGKAPDREELIAFFEDEVLPNVQGQIDDLAELTPPEADQGEVDELIASAQEAIDKSEGDMEAVVASDENPFDDADEKAGAYGLAECAI
ncbi:MAG: hypothetical protein WKF94_08750 [Solirubrobacteraceae bacterium]